VPDRSHIDPSQGRPGWSHLGTMCRKTNTFQQKYLTLLGKFFGLSSVGSGVCLAEVQSESLVVHWLATMNEVEYLC
jgi:hypothetical protein